MKPLYLNLSLCMCFLYVGLLVSVAGVLDHVFYTKPWGKDRYIFWP